MDSEIQNQTKIGGTSQISDNSAVSKSHSPPPPPAPGGIAGSIANAESQTGTVDSEKSTAPTQAPSQPSDSPPAAQETISPQDVMNSAPEKKSRFTTVIVVLVLITLVVYAVVGYLYMSNKKLKEPSPQPVPEEAVPSVTPTPSFSPEQIKLINGSIYNALPTGENKLLVNKDDYKSTGITGFARVSVSPNNNMVCFEAWPPAPTTSIFLSDIEGAGTYEVGKDRKNCHWLKDSNKIVYTNTTSDSLPVDIYVHNLSTKEETNLTQDLVTEGNVRYYEISGENEDKTALVCRYDEVDQVSGEDALEGHCQIDLSTGEIQDIETTQ